jgi:hypothetical protein
MNSKKVILLYTIFYKIINSNTEYLNELKKSNTFWLSVVTEFNFFQLISKILGATIKKFLSNTWYLNKFKKSNT